jgi:F-type H+-transporting ATPase subunit gamma
MANLKAIRKRIASVKNTQKITRAMKLVSAAKLRRAQQAMMELRPYAAKHRELLESLARQLAESGESNAHPLLTPRDEVKTVAVFALSSDRGMCGAFNAGIVRKLNEVVRERTAAGQQVVLYTLGRRMGIAGRKLKVLELHDLAEIITAGDQARVREITAALVKAFIEGAVDEVVVVSNRFKSALTQLPTVYSLLPVAPPASTEPAQAASGADLFYEPGQNDLLGYVVPRFVEVQVRQAILESIAGEHAARMNAMSSATDNANGMIQSLTLEMNRARQAAITKELMEIIGGAEAMK